ncbi:MAG: lysylphosphatidylglycerol synthase transmembrane domain-containing protein, partial [Planctomycetia bacterium]|nr:lysylphosphatidylglycerol synthase transmembrane domain-containing protein [Planctomycetia bacterium]
MKIGISLGILLFLVYQAMQDEETMKQLLHGEKIWTSLALGFFFTFLAVLATIVRWWWLMRIQKMPARFWNTLRVGYIGYLFNLAPMGIVGGDLLKAWLLTRQMKKEEEHAGSVILASVFIDRMIGLYAIFMMAGLAVLGMGVLWQPELSPTLEKASWAVLIAWGIGTVAGLALLCPSPSSRELPPPRSRFEETFRRIATSVRLYRNFPGKLTMIVIISVLIHASFATSIYFLADGIYRAIAPPTFAQHMYISPTSMSMTAIPLPVGPVEMVMDDLYHDVTGRTGMGLAVTLAYRFICLLIALL